MIHPFFYLVGAFGTLAAAGLYIYQTITVPRPSQFTKQSAHSKGSETMPLDDKKIHEIPLDQIRPGPFQYRREFVEAQLEGLADLIEMSGQLQPILVRKCPDNTYEIVDGERRWRAMHILTKRKQAAGDGASTLTANCTIEAIFINADNPLPGLLANLARVEYNPLETAEALACIKENLGDSATDEQVANRVGRKRSTVTEYMSLLKLPDVIKDKAKKDSCVPFRSLKVLAASKDSEEEKIDAYMELEAKYSAEGGADEQESAEPDKQDKGLRIVTATQKKLCKLQESFNRIKPEAISEEGKQLLRASLDETIKSAKALLELLSV